mmetsp:Transcript_5921/g.16412  ORF Transcript_5921/g.16412 Transcript_5921/m.16412 type:complete len:427 (-) Transcript_5921:643-1923(-)
MQPLQEHNLFLDIRSAIHQVQHPRRDLDASFRPHGLDGRLHVVPHEPLHALRHARGRGDGGRDGDALSVGAVEILLDDVHVVPAGVVQQPIDLVEDHGFQASQTQATFCEVVHQAPGRRNHDRGLVVLQVLVFLHYSAAADQARDFQILEGFQEVAQDAPLLLRELPGGRHDDHRRAHPDLRVDDFFPREWLEEPDLLLELILLVLVHDPVLQRQNVLRHQRHEEGQGLSATRHRRQNHIFVGQDGGNGLGLQIVRALDAEVLKGRLYLRHAWAVQAELLPAPTCRICPTFLALHHEPRQFVQLPHHRAHRLRLVPAADAVDPRLSLPHHVLHVFVALWHRDHVQRVILDAHRPQFLRPGLAAVVVGEPQGALRVLLRLRLAVGLRLRDEPTLRVQLPLVGLGGLLALLAVWDHCACVKGGTRHPC